MHRALIPVLSSNIDGYRYINDRQLLLIAFKAGTTYAYEDVPDSVVLEFMNATSKGAFFGNSIRNIFTATKLDDMAVANVLFGLENVPQEKPVPRMPSLMLPKLQLKYPMLSAMF